MEDLNNSTLKNKSQKLSRDVALNTVFEKANEQGYQEYVDMFKTQAYPYADYIKKCEEIETMLSTVNNDNEIFPDGIAVDLDFEVLYNNNLHKKLFNKEIENEALASVSYFLHSAIKKERAEFYMQNSLIAEKQ
jgi:hypothetical protein